MNYIRGSDGLTSEDATRNNLNRVRMGNHPFLTRPDGTNMASDRVKKGTNPFLKRDDGSSISSNRVKDGSHNWLTRPDRTNSNTDRIADGTHNFLIKGLVPCYNKAGELKRIPKEQYYSQSGPIENREWVHNTSKEGKRRKLK